MEEIKNYLIEHGYMVRVLENDLARLVCVKIITDKLINMYISFRDGEYEADTYIHQRQFDTRKLFVKVSTPSELITQIKSLEESCL